MQKIALNQSQPGPSNNPISYNNSKNNNNSFENILKQTYQKTSLHGNHLKQTAHGNDLSSVKLLALGKISNENPTVSDILVNHPQYGKKCWQIIHSLQNRQKAFNTIQPGARVFINPQTYEITWKYPGKKPSSISSHPTATIENPTVVQPRGKTPTSSQLQYLGRITDKNPTVSSLMVKNADLGKRCWSIIHKGKNQSKPFEKISPGTAIYIDAQTHEIHWDSQETASPKERKSGIPNALPYPTLSEMGKKSRHFLSDRLESSVRSYLGKPYAEINCYELVIRGLKHAGIQYSGKDGLKYRLVQKAINEGRPTNSYLTGEGIIKTTASEVYSKTLKQISHPDQATQDIIKEVAPLLSNGQILSFSTSTKGHMGIISNNGSVWTFINSGYLDNQFGVRRMKKGVGEENLAAEIDNWVRLAAKRKEPLQISIGTVSGTKLAAERLTIQENFNS